MIQEHALDVLVLDAVQIIIRGADDVFIGGLHFLVIGGSFRKGVQIFLSGRVDLRLHGIDLRRINIEIQPDLPDPDSLESAHIRIAVDPEEFRMIDNNSVQSTFDVLRVLCPERKLGPFFSYTGVKLCVDGLYLLRKLVISEAA